MSQAGSPQIARRRIVSRRFSITRLGFFASVGVLALGLLAGCSGGGGPGGGGGSGSGAPFDNTNTLPDDRTGGPDGTGSVGHAPEIPPRPAVEDLTLY